jgi:hypothetical protein
MALSSTIAADFSEFVEECKKADAGLASIEQASKETEAALTEMGTSGTTAVGKTGDALADVGTKAKKAGGDAAGMKDGLEVADQALDALGINVGKQINDLKQLGNVSLDTSTLIGKLGTAISVASAAMVGWQIGRKIAELTGSDKIIGDATASILGWRDAGQAAANNADVLQRAFEKTGQVFTDVHAASEALRKASAANAEQFNTGAQRVKGWTAELAGAKGGVGALKAEIEANNSTTAEMARHFGVSERAIDYLKRQMDASAASLKDFNAEQDKAAQKAQQQADALQRLRESMFGTDTIAKAQQYVAALGPIENLTRMSTAAQTSMNAELGKAIEAYTRMGQVAPQALRDIYTATLPLPPIIAGLGDAWANVGKVAIPTTESILGPMKQLTQEAAAYEAETQRQADAWNRGERAGQSYAATTRTVAQETAQTTQQIVQLNAALGQNATAYDAAIAGAQLLRAYIEAGVATSGNIGLAGYEFKQLQQTGVPGGWGGVSWANRTPTPTETWGRGGATQTTNTLNVNVNSTDAQDIAQKLVTEMRHSGVRLG